MTDLASVTRNYRKLNSLSQEEFGAALAEQLPEYSFTKQAVSQWEKGKNKPDFEFLVLSAMRYSDWRRDWAFECLAALRPEVFSAPE